MPAVLLSCLLVIGLPEGSALRLVTAGVALLFLPGYALTLAVFPESRTEGNEAQTPLNRGYSESTMSALDPFERLALAFGFGVCLMPVYGYAVGVAGAGYEPQTVIVLVSAATTLFTALAAIRYRISSTDLDAPSPFVSLAGTVTDGVSAPTSGKRALNVAVVVMLVLAAANLTAAMASPAQSPEYTTAVLLTENEEGELVADGYPDQLRAGETADLVLRVENRESQAVDYEVVVQLQRVSADGTVTEASVRDRFEQTVDAGSAWERDHRVASDMSGERIRIAYLIYKGEAPAEPTLENSYRNLTLWVGSEGSDVEEGVVGEPATPSLSAASADRPGPEPLSGDRRAIDVTRAGTVAEAP
ncbi:DUF1616 domain-containing protein [Halorubrum depositum]|uniref:DUF1616 domain-containing protein n=1 Tax=Halorubrum depositum TaxID=2583992 RepID=UPI001642C92F|nr:DUF1616 domain-containing protein [Halorubrum depositum]